MARASRLRRKELKQPDEFITLTSRAVLWLRARAQTATWVAVGIVVLIGVAGILVSFRSARVREANQDLGQAMLALQGEDLGQAASQLSEVARRWNETKAGGLAGLLAAHAELRRGNYDSALVLIERLWEPAHDFPPYIRQQILLSWGAALEGKGELEAAAEKYGRSAGLSGPYSGPAILAQARVREKAGATEQARELYRKYLEDFPDFPDQELVQAKLGS